MKKFLVSIIFAVTLIAGGNTTYAGQLIPQATAETCDPSKLLYFEQYGSPNVAMNVTHYGNNKRAWMQIRNSYERARPTARNVIRLCPGYFKTGAKTYDERFLDMDEETYDEDEDPVVRFPENEELEQYELEDEPMEVPDDKVERIVPYHGDVPAGYIDIQINTHTLYYVLEGGRAFRMPIAGPKPERKWKGTVSVCDMKEYPRWQPSDSMVASSEFAAKYSEGIEGGDPENPLGSRALYLCVNDEDTGYRIHGTSKSLRSSIGTDASFGCIRSLNEDIEGLYTYVRKGTRVVVTDNSFE